jgi:hypothetical protein
MRRTYVRKLAEAMQRGEWRANGEPVHIAEDGTLLNGQHRLSAVVLSRQTIPLLLVRGLPREAQRTIDTGARRTLSDVLRMREVPEPTNLAAALGLLYRYRNGHRFDGAGHTAPTTIEALELLAAEPELANTISIGRLVNKATRMRISVVTVLAYLFDEVSDENEGSYFFTLLAEAESQPYGSAIRALDSILSTARKRTYKLTTYTLAAMTIKAFDAWREGREVYVLTFKAGGKTPEPFPEIRRVEAEFVVEAEDGIDDELYADTDLG